MRRDSNINQFIPLHFYEPSEKLPTDEELKIVICKTQKGFLSWNRAYYDKSGYWHGSGSMSNVIAWASFSPGWVTGSESFPEKWGCQ